MYVNTHTPTIIMYHPHVMGITSRADVYGNGSYFPSLTYRLILTPICKMTMIYIKQPSLRISFMTLVRYYGWLYLPVLVVLWMYTSSCEVIRWLLFSCRYQHQVNSAWTTWIFLCEGKWYSYNPTYWHNFWYEWTWYYYWLNLRSRY